MINKENKITVYEPNHIMKAGIRVWADMFSELIEFRGLIWRLMVRDIAARYKQSVFGILWAFIVPLFMTLIFVWAKERKIFPIGHTVIPYAAFVFIGQIVWLLFSRGVTTSASSLVAAGNMLTKTNFPREVLIFSAIGQTIFEFLVRIPLLVFVLIYVGFTPGFSTIFVPVVLLPLLLLTLGLGFIVALLNSIVRDISSVLGIIINLGIFVTPVIYPPPTSWPLSFLINTVNPVSGYLTVVRDLMTVGSMNDPSGYIISSIVSVLLFLIGWRLFHLTEPKIAERV